MLYPLAASICAGWSPLLMKQTLLLLGAAAQGSAATVFAEPSTYFIIAGVCISGPLQLACLARGLRNVEAQLMVRGHGHTRPHSILSFVHADACCSTYPCIMHAGADLRFSLHRLLHPRRVHLLQGAPPLLRGCGGGAEHQLQLVFLDHSCCTLQPPEVPSPQL